MPRAATIDLETFLRQLPSGTTADLLLELAREFEPVAKRLQRLQLATDPKRLAANFRKSLAGWRRATRFLNYRDADGFSLELRTWLDQIERELLPIDPAAALDLFQAFVESDARFFERADDSDGAIGGAIAAGCRMWLKAAAACETPAGAWPDRLDALASGDEYGARESLYRQANELLDEPALRRLADRHMERMKAALVGVGDRGSLPTSVFAISGTLGLLSEALADPDVQVDAVLAYSPQPNTRQMEGFVRAYLDCGRPAEALEWLDQPWDSMTDTRERLRAEALLQLGRPGDAAAILQGVFETTLSVHDLSAWMAAVPPAGQSEASSRAREVAVAHDVPAAAACVLIALDDPEAAEARLLAAPAGRIDGKDYSVLLPIAKALESAQCGAGATAVYRALLDAILAKGYAPAYGHAARYWDRLAVIAADGVDLGPLPAHEAYVAKIRGQHARKASFWAEVNRKQRVAPTGED